MDYFKDYILNEEPKIYPDSYLKNKRLMDLVKTHKDPMKFLFAVITQMNRSKLNLKRIGAASTREVAALWNDFNDNKINMSMVESVLQERRETIKGWVNPQKKKVIQTKGMKPYHVMMIAKNPRQFGMQQKTILNRLEIGFDAMDSPEPEADAKEHLAALKSGVRDVDRSVEVLAMKRGWYRVYGGEWCEISGVKSLSDRELTQILELMQENGMIAYGGREMKELELQVYIPPKKNDRYQSVDVKPDGRLQQFEIQNLLSGKRRGFKQTEIGRTMAMFRDHVEKCGCDEIKEEVTIIENGEKKNVKLNDPIRTSEVPSKKFKVYVRNEKGKVVVVRFGDPNMEIKRDDPERRKSFRARHNCDNPGPKTKARYWSCYQWRGGDKKVDN